MQLLTPDHLPSITVDAEFRYSRLQPLVISLVCLSLALLAIAAAVGSIPRWLLPVFFLWVLAIFFLGTAFLMYLGFKQVSQDQNWRCRFSGNKMWIRCGANDDALIIEVDRSELLWAQPVRVTAVSSDAPGDRKWTFYHYIDLGLTPGAAALLEQFAQDKQVPEKTREQLVAQDPSLPQYVAFTLTLNKPVQMLQGEVLRLYWGGMKPGLRKAGQFFSKWTEWRPLRKQKIEQRLNLEVGPNSGFTAP